MALVFQYMASLKSYGAIVDFWKILKKHTIWEKNHRAQNKLQNHCETSFPILRETFLKREN